MGPSRKDPPMPATTTRAYTPKLQGDRSALWQNHGLGEPGLAIWLALRPIRNRMESEGWEKSASRHDDSSQVPPGGLPRGPAVPKNGAQ